MDARRRHKRRSLRLETRFRDEPLEPLEIGAQVSALFGWQMNAATQRASNWFNAVWRALPAGSSHAKGILSSSLRASPNRSRTLLA